MMHVALIGLLHLLHAADKVDDGAWFDQRSFSGHTLTLLPDGASLTAARTALLEGATRSIYLSSYAFYDDESARAVLSTLCAKARAGLDVRILVDDHGGSRMLKHADETRACGVRVLAYNTSHWGVPWFRQRLHEKLLIVDGQTVISGGSGYANHYTHASHDSPEWHDLDVATKGPAACWFHLRFKTEWTRVALTEIRPDRKIYEDEQGQRILKRLYGLDEFRSCDTTVPTGGARVFPLEQDQMFEGGHWLLNTHLAAIKASQGRITLYSPYFNSEEKLLQALIAARARGVHVTVLTNSAKSNDEPQSHLGMLRSATRLIKAGIEIRVWNHASLLHRKGGVYGERWAFFGSDNLDRGAHEYNVEDVSFTDDPAFVREMTAALDEDLADSTPLTEKAVSVELSHYSAWRKFLNWLYWRYL